jgi:tetratricopeptide (TPR) repeat protein
MTANLQRAEAEWSSTEELGTRAVLKEANSQKRWDQLWSHSASRDWRKVALADVYVRIADISMDALRIVDLGGGVGALAETLLDCDSTKTVEVWDHSEAALDQWHEKGGFTQKLDLRTLDPYDLHEHSQVLDFVVATEVLEHFEEETRKRFYATANTARSAIFTVPNNRLGPDEEPQHARKFTALEFLTELREHFEHARVECIGAFLLGVVGEAAIKRTTLSACFPCRDEATAVGKTLASLRGAADEIVIGVDPRTTDDTFEIAKQYAEKVFYLEDPRGPGQWWHNERSGTEYWCPDGEYMPENGVHFAWIRNQVMDRCEGEYIFMTEAHESLLDGQDILLELERYLPKGTMLVNVMRTGGREQWLFPWLVRNHKDIRYKRSTHNTIELRDNWPVVTIPSIKTLHEQPYDRKRARAKQRKVQNRVDLMSDWLRNANEASLFYLANEWRGLDMERAKRYFERLIATSRQGGRRYQARLNLSKIYTEYHIQGREVEDGEEKPIDAAKRVLFGCTADNWMRAEHWIHLGDIATMEGEKRKAATLYRYASTFIGAPPLTGWWIDRAYYSELPAQRLAMTYAALGNFKEALHWAERVVELLPEDSPERAMEDSKRNVRAIRKAMGLPPEEEEERDEE